MDKDLNNINISLNKQNKYLEMCIGTQETTIKKLYTTIKRRDYLILQQLKELRQLRRLVIENK